MTFLSKLARISREKCCDLIDLMVAPRNRARTEVSSQALLAIQVPRDTLDAALQTFAALMFSGFLFSLSVETDPPGLMCFHTRHAATRDRQTDAVQGLHFANIQSTVVIGMSPISSENFAYI